MSFTCPNCKIVTVQYIDSLHAPPVKTLQEVECCEACTQAHQIAQDAKEFRAERDQFETLYKRAAQERDALFAEVIHYKTKHFEQILKLTEERDALRDALRLLKEQIADADGFAWGSKVQRGERDVLRDKVTELEKRVARLEKPSNGYDPDRERILSEIPAEKRGTKGFGSTGGRS